MKNEKYQAPLNIYISSSYDDAELAQKFLSDYVKGFGITVDKQRNGDELYVTIDGLDEDIDTLVSVYTAQYDEFKKDCKAEPSGWVSPVNFEKSKEDESMKSESNIEDLRDQTISWGTMRSEDLIPKFLGVLKTYAKDKYDVYVNENPEVLDIDGLDDETLGWIVDELFDELDKIAPEGTYFGAHPDDGADYGFWSVEESKQHEAKKSEGKSDKDCKGKGCDGYDEKCGGYKKKENRGKPQEGPGAGYDVTFEDVDVKDVSVTFNEAKDAFDVALKISARMNAEGYDWDTQYYREYMGYEPEDDEITLKFSLPNSSLKQDWADMDMADASIEEKVKALDEAFHSVDLQKFGYGGGYSHSKFNPGRVDNVLVYPFEYDGAYIEPCQSNSSLLEYNTYIPLEMDVQGTFAQDVEGACNYSSDLYDYTEKVRDIVKDLLPEQEISDSNISDDRCEDYFTGGWDAEDAANEIADELRDSSESKKSEYYQDWVAYYFCKDPQGLEWAVLPHTVSMIGNVNCVNARGGMESIGKEYVLSKCTPVEDVESSEIWKAVCDGEDRKVVAIDRNDAERVLRAENGLEELKSVVAGKDESKKNERGSTQIETYDGFEELIGYADAEYVLEDVVDVLSKYYTYEGEGDDIVFDEDQAKDDPEFTIKIEGGDERANYYYENKFYVHLPSKDAAEELAKVLGGELNESKKNEDTYDRPVTLYASTRYDDAEEAQKFLDSISGGEVKVSKERNGDTLSVSIEGDDDAIDTFLAVYKDNYDTLEKDCDADVNGWTDPVDLKYYTVQGRKELTGESCKKSESGLHDAYYAKALQAVDRAIEITHDQFDITGDVAKFDADLKKYLISYVDSLNDTHLANIGLLGDLRDRIKDFARGDREEWWKNRKQGEAKKSESLTLKQAELKKMAKYGEAEDITGLSDAEAKELKKSGVELVGISRGTYGMNGALMRGTADGKLYVITSRNSNLFYFV